MLDVDGWPREHRLKFDNSVSQTNALALPYDDDSVALLLGEEPRFDSQDSNNVVGLFFPTPPATVITRVTACS